MSDKVQKFRQFLADLKSNSKQKDGVYIPDQLTHLLKNRGVILIKQSDVRNIEIAAAELEKAEQSIAVALAAIHYFHDVDHKQLKETRETLGSYRVVLTDIVKKAFQRRRDAVLGVAA